MQRSVHMTRLGIALMSVTVATVALAMPKAFARTGSCTPLAVEAAYLRGPDARVQRPPRVPRRERFVAGPSSAAAAGSDD